MASTDSDAAIREIAAGITAAWNAADGGAFARYFTEDADFVTIYALHAVGRAAIEQNHQMIFDGVYRGSRNVFSAVKVRQLTPDVVLALVTAHLQIPHGPMAGELTSLATAVIVRDGSGWSIAAFHNTREQAPPSPPPS